MSVTCLILRNQVVTFLIYPEQLKQVRFLIKILIIVGHYVSDVFDIKKSETEVRAKRERTGYIFCYLNK
jgi:hypothetical protein